MATKIWKLCGVAVLALALAGTARAADQPRPSRITAAVDEAQATILGGNTRPEATAKNDRGVVATDVVLEHMQLQLRRSAEEEARVASFIDSLQDPTSPNYHQWLTAEEFGSRFGATPEDLQRVTRWLASHGFQVNTIHPSRMLVDFTGTTGQVKKAFHTEIHRLDVDGVAHIANIGDPAIPTALTPVVAGVVSLHDFRGQSRRVARPRFSGTCQGAACYLVGPADLATIYNFNPLFAKGITGKGQIIAVIEDSNLYNTADWTNFRQIFGLSSYSFGSLTTVHPAPVSGRSNCANPGVNANDVEATLDAEWASAAAPNATIMVASCADTATTTGIFLATQTLVNGAAPPPIISISYGICEAMDTAADKTAFNSLYQMAAARGISVFVATGDNGPSDCGSGNGTKYGIGINAWAATQYNVAVGGTDFSDSFSKTGSTYWGSSTALPWGSAKSYIPETPWNDTCASTLLATYYGSASTVTYGASGFCNSRNGASYLSLGGGEGGPSGCFTGTPSIYGLVSGNCKGYPKPSWQTGVIGIPADGVRDVPDVSMFAADGVWNHQYLLCFSDRHNGGAACTGNPAVWGAGGGGTSYAAPIVAGIQALVNQNLGGKPQGNPAPIYYQLAAKEYGSTGNAQCNSSLGNKIATNCVFNDVTFGNNDVDCTGSNNCYDPSGRYGVLSTSNTSYAPAYTATTGYDFATGLGTINAANLVANWPTK